MTTWKSNNFSEDKLPSPTDDASSHDDLDIERDNEAQQNHENANGEKIHALEKVKSSASKRGDIDPFGEPPDGGLNAWLKVLGCFLLYSNIW
jgi:hypothetical protein